MEKIIKYVEYLVKLEFMKARHEVFVNDSGSKGVDFIIRAKSGKQYISRGAVFSYYEFKEDKIYNDEEWRKLIKNNKDFKRPEWISPIINNINPLKGQMQFRYVGSDM